MRKIIIIFSLILISQGIAENVKYLILCADRYVEYVEPLAEWKRQKGITTKLLSIPIGRTSAALKDTIKKYKPEYVLLVGDMYLIPFGKYFPKWVLYSPPRGMWTDQYYADTTNDTKYRDQLYVGRLNCSSEIEVYTQVQKIIAYEKGMFKKGNWILKACGVARNGEANEHFDSCYTAAIRAIRTNLLTNGFVSMDTIFSSTGATGGTVQESVTKGRGYVVYRGSTSSSADNWNSPMGTDPSQIDNDSMPAIVISATCRNMLYPESLPTYPIPTTCAGYNWMKAHGEDLNIPRGAVAYFGTATHYFGNTDSTDTLDDRQTIWRNAAAVKFFKVLTQDTLYNLAKILRKTKDSIYACCSTYTYGQPYYATACSVAYMEWNLLGDPEMNIYDSMPKRMTVTCDTVINTDSMGYYITVRDSISQGLMQNVLVCMMMDTLIYNRGYTNSSGVISFPLHPSATGIMTVTATKRNYIPKIKNVRIIENHDAGVTEITRPTGLVDSTMRVIPRAKVKNFGFQKESFNVTFSIIEDTLVWSSTKQVNSLMPESIKTVDFDTWPIHMRGTYTVRCSTYLATDTLWLNNMMSSSFSIIVHDIGVTEMIEPSGTIDSTASVIPRVRIENFGTQTETLNVTYKIIKGTTWTNTKQVSIVSGYNSVITFSAWTVGIRGSYTARCSTSLATDMVSNNNKLSDSFFIRVYDVGATKIQAPRGTIDSVTAIAPACSLYNYGNETTSYQVRIKIDNFYEQVDSILNHAPLTYKYLSFPGYSTWLRGTHVVRCSTELENDMNAGNSRKIDSFSVRVRDVGCSKIVVPSGQVGQGLLITPVCSLYNYGTTTESYRARLKIGTFYNDTVSIANHAAGTYMRVTFANWNTIQTGLHAVTCSTEFTSDMKAVNDKKTGAVACSITVSIINATIDSNGIIEPSGEVMVEYNHDTTFSIIPNTGHHIGQVYVDSAPVGAIPTYTFHNIVANHSIRAHFIVNQYTLTASAGSNGVIVPSGSININFGQDTTFHIRPNLGYHVAYLIVDNDTIVPDTIYRFTSISQNHSIRAEFAINTYTLHIDTTGLGGVTITPNQMNYNYGTWVRLVATHAVGWHFVNWTGDLTSSNSQDSIYMNGNKIITANFAIDTHTLIVSVVGSGSVTKYPDQMVYNYGTSVQLTAVPITGWHFIGWTGDTITTANPIVVSMISDKNFTATFTINTYTLNIIIIGNGAVSVDPNQMVYDYNTVVDLTALPSEDWAFENWTGSVSSTDMHITITMNMNKNITATFVYAGVEGWGQKESILTMVDGMYVKDGGAMVAVTGIKNGSCLYAFRGNRSREFYRYTPSYAGSWYAIETLCFGSRPYDSTKVIKRPIGKGAALCFDGTNTIYATKGNGTKEFWAYTISDSTWRMKQFVPSQRTLKGGTSLAYYGGKVYLLAGNQRRTDSANFFAYNPVNDTWTIKHSLTIGNNNKIWKDGSCITELNSTIYAIKGGDKYNAFYAYNIASDSWEEKQPIPLSESLFGKLRKIHVKNGGAITSGGDAIYVLKGGGANTFWKYTQSTGWAHLETIPRLHKKSAPKAGAAIAYLNGKIWLLKGNNTSEFWKYIPPTKMTTRTVQNNVGQNINANALISGQEIVFSVYPNPLTKFTNIRYSIVKSGHISIRLCNTTGSIIQTLVDDYFPAGRYAFRLSSKNLAKGIYFLEYKTDNYKNNTKIVFQ